MTGALVLASAAVVFALLLMTVRRWDRAYPSTNPAESTWWFGYARDAANAIGFAAFSAGFAVLGFAAPQALLLGAAFGLLAYGVDYAVARAATARRPGLLVGAILVACAVGAAACRDLLAAGVATLWRVLF